MNGAEHEGQELGRYQFLWMQIIPLEFSKKVKKGRPQKLVQNCKLFSTSYLNVCNKSAAEHSPRSYQVNLVSTEQFKLSLRKVKVLTALSQLLGHRR